MTGERSNPFDVGDLIESVPAKPVTMPQQANTALDQSQSPQGSTESGRSADKSSDRPSRAQMEQLARETGFVSRERPRMGRRLRTGRDRQLNLKVRDADLERFYAIADAEKITLGEAFERALDALEEKRRGR